VVSIDRERLHRRCDDLDQAKFESNSPILDAFSADADDAVFGRRGCAVPLRYRAVRPTVPADLAGIEEVAFA
jgi:hypothetical protein